MTFFLLHLQVSSDESEQYVGTGPFTAPEALDGGDPSRLGAKADIFSLGCVIYEMLALEAPHVNLLRVDYDDEDDDDEDDDDGEAYSVLPILLDLQKYLLLFLDSFSEAQDAYEDALGSRPALPERLDWLGGDEEYRTVLSIFYACTEEDPDKRPKAKDVAQCCQKDLT